MDVFRLLLTLTFLGLSFDGRAEPEDLTLPGGTHLTYVYSPASSALLIAPVGDDVIDAGETLYFRDWLEQDAADGTPLAGPHFDQGTCAACHIETAGQPSDNEFLIARPIGKAAQARFGEQITTQHWARGVPEAEIAVHHERREFVYPDGRTRLLRKPVAIARLPNGERLLVKQRAASLLFGWGLLENVDREMLESFHDPLDRNHDGISGRFNWVRNWLTGKLEVGRFGWKNSHPSLRQQIAAALNNDMGVTSSLTCEQDCAPEISPSDLHALTHYVRHLGVPDRRAGATPEGEALFGTVGCSSCHVPALLTVDSDSPAVDNQVIWAYSDLMLHDMGDDLADPGSALDAREWRTAPLWGIGLVEEHLPQHGFLHDGRARSIEDAILWHGGEADESRNRFADLAADERQALLNYVRSL